MLTRRGLLKSAVAGVAGLLGLTAVVVSKARGDEGSVWLMSHPSWVNPRAVRFSRVDDPNDWDFSPGSSFRNYTGQYTGTTREELIAKMRQLARTTKFHPPLAECKFRDAQVDLSKLIL